MEIPAGKGCWQVDMSQAIHGCGLPVTCPFLHDNHPDEEDFDVDCTAFDHHFDTRCGFPPFRCPACLAAYPNGATIEIKPK